MRQLAPVATSSLPATGTGQTKRTQAAPSRRSRATQARIATLHTAVANARRDGLHKASTRLARTFAALVVEDLTASAMTTNRRLTRHVAGVAMAELPHQIQYNTTWPGVHVHLASR
jgi:putative transposase